MGMLLRFWLVLAVFCLPDALGSFSQELSNVDDSVVEAESKSKALRLHQVLQRRPALGFLLDRFIDAWLEFSSTEDLELFLRQQAESKNAPNDLTLLAFFYVKQNDHVRALSHFQLALAQNSNLPVVWYEKALVAARALDFDSALQDLTTAAQVNASDARLLA
jgi:tetratricopeptide (TPR) repeat protein